MRALTRAEDVTVDYATVVGTDSLSSKMLAFLKANGVGTRFIKEVSDRTVGLYLITLTGAERNFTYWRSASAARLLAEDKAALSDVLSQADAIYFSGITLAILSPGHRRNLLSVLQEMKSRGATIAFDSNARRRLWPSDRAMKAAMIAGYKASTLALPTFSDDQALFGDATPAECARRIAGYGVKEIVVKDGGNPCVVSVGTNLFSVAPEPVQDVVDTTGAGDSFNAGYHCGAHVQPRAAGCRKVGPSGCGPGYPRARRTSRHGVVFRSRCRVIGVDSVPRPVLNSSMKAGA